MLAPSSLASSPFSSCSSPIRTLGNGEEQGSPPSSEMKASVAWPPPAHTLARMPALAALVEQEQHARNEWLALDKAGDKGRSTHAHAMSTEALRELVVARTGGDDDATSEWTRDDLVEFILGVWREEAEQRKRLAGATTVSSAVPNKKYARVVSLPGGPRGEILAGDLDGKPAVPARMPLPPRPAVPASAVTDVVPRGRFDGRPDDIAALLARAHAKDIAIAEVLSESDKRSTFEAFVERYDDDDIVVDIDDVDDRAEVDDGRWEGLTRPKKRVQRNQADIPDAKFTWTGSDGMAAVIATALSARHMADLVYAVRFEATREDGGYEDEDGKPLAKARVEGVAPDSEWAICEVGDVVVHVLVGDDARDRYNIERIWRRRGAKVREFFSMEPLR
ncbi:ribosome silencing factor [Pseudoscourfieldia marina]